MQMSSSANLLVISIADDGRGLDYDALRRRGYERGLLSPNHSPSNQELAKLIFHPGFSTRDTASEISGRGVGMDVVATAIDQMHGRIETDSVSGQGTMIRLSIPLRSGIEHAMVFRSGLLFAIPMHAVSAAQNQSDPMDSNGCHNLDSDYFELAIPSVQLSNTPDQEPANVAAKLALELDTGNRGPRQRIRLMVDEILGGEEVVVRALPRAIQDHPFVSGMTLSGGGQIVLMVDPSRLCDLGLLLNAEPIELEGRRVGPASYPIAAAKRILVVDDSLSARTSLTRRLNGYGMEIVEACDGMEALDHIRTHSFDMVFTDLDMPRLGGLELLSEIRQRRLVKTPVVVISSRTEENIRNRALRYGARAFLNKPVSDETLSQLLQQFQLLEV